MREIHATVTLENIEDPSRQTTVEAPPPGDENRRLRRRPAGATGRRQHQDRNRRC